MKLIDFLPFDVGLTDDIVPELVLLKLEQGETISLNHRLIKMESISKYNGKLEYIVASAKLNVFGVSKSIYVWKVGSHYSMHGTTGKGKGKKADWLHNLLRDIEGILVCDSINKFNILHQFSELHQIYNRGIAN